MWTDSLLRSKRTYPVAGKGLPDSVSFVTGVLNRLKLIEPLILVWWCLVLSLMCSTITRIVTGSTGFAYHVLVIAGSGGCAWFWFLSRNLFRNRKDLGLKVFSVVPVVVSIEAIAALMSPVGTGELVNEAGRVFGNAASVACIASIVFVWYEILHGYKNTRTSAERRFRAIYMLAFSLIVGITILWVSGAGSDSFAAEWETVLLTVCAFIALTGSRAAVQYRLKNPLDKPTQSKRFQISQSETVSVNLIAQSIIEAIKDEVILTTPNLKVSEFADSIGEQEYKVTRCITSYLGFRNFNHFLNSHRIDRAKGIFNNHENRHLTIATVAYDCGFNSLGPFNRAFKLYTGLTPREFRHK